MSITEPAGRAPPTEGIPMTRIPSRSASLTAKRKELYEIKHPETRAAGMNRAIGNDVAAKSAATFTQDTAKKSGQSQRAVQIDARRGEKIEPEGRFAAIRTAIKKQEKDIRRARRRATALWHQDNKRMTPASITAAGAKPLRMLQEILSHADVIALDTEGLGARRVHMLVTLPVRLLDQATALAAIDEDDEDTDGGEDNQDKEEGEDDEYSLGIPDAIVDQSRKFPTTIGVDGYWQHTEQDLELDPAEREPSLGSLGSSDANFDQDRWAAGDRLDRERGERGGDCDDDEENGDREPGEDDEPDHDNEDDVRDWPMHGSIEAEWWRGCAPASMNAPAGRPKIGLAENPISKPPTLAESGIDKHLAALAPLTADGETPALWLPTGTDRPDGGLEMQNQTTGATVVWRLLSRDGRSFL